MKTKLSINGTKFEINGKLTYEEYSACPQEYRGRLMNARFIQGIFDDREDRSRFNRFGREFDPERNAEDLIQHLPEWYEKGIRALTVGLQGGGPCYTVDSMTIDNNPFSKDGTELDPAYLARLEKIITAADEIGMVVIVSFYYCAQSRFLQDDLAVINGVKTASNWLRDKKFTNVIIEIANEHDVESYSIHPILFDGKGIAQLIRIAQRESGGMPVGCSTTGKYFSKDIGETSDVILIHGNNMTRQQFYEHINEAKKITPARPIVCNEDSQALGNMQVALENGISWGYYNNMTKQEPPTTWGITRGEDEFYAERLAETLGILKASRSEEDEFYLEGLGKNEEWEGKRWIRLASKYPEKIHKVDFYRDGKFYASAYDDPFTIGFVVNWYQKPVEGVQKGEHWKADVVLTTGKIISKEVVVE